MQDSKQIIEDLVDRIVAFCNPEKIILFGSHVRDSATPDSDVDLLVVLPVKGSVRKKANEIDMALSYRTFPLDLIVITPEMLSKQKNAPGAVVRQALMEGKVLYERAA